MLFSLFLLDSWQIMSHKSQILETSGILSNCSRFTLLVVSLYNSGIVALIHFYEAKVTYLYIVVLPIRADNFIFPKS